MSCAATRVYLTFSEVHTKPICLISQGCCNPKCTELSCLHGNDPFLTESNRSLPSEVGLQIMVDGRVPTGSGLSSSSALTCAVVVAVMAAHNLSFTKVEVADLACKCERYCGTQSGGMDQVSANTPACTLQL
jgi:galactokinase